MRVKPVEGIEVLEHPAFSEGAFLDKYDYTSHFITTEHVTPDTRQNYPEWWLVFGERVFNVSAPFKCAGRPTVRGIRWEEYDTEGFFEARKADADFEAALDEWWSDDDALDVNEAFPCSDTDAERIRRWGQLVANTKYKTINF